MATGRILTIVTNAGAYEAVGYCTGLWLGELTHFYDHVTGNGCTVDIARPQGGYVPIGPESLTPAISVERLAGWASTPRAPRTLPG